MGLPNINFVESGSNLSRKLQSADGQCGILFYLTVPATFTAEPVKKIFSLAEAESLGLTSADEAIAHYHISEFFRLNPAGSLWVAFYAPEVGETPVHDFAEVVSMQLSTEGEIRVLGVYTQLAYIVGQVTALQTKAVACAAEEMPLSAVLVSDFSDVTLSSIATIATSASPNVSVLLAQDGDGVGADLFEDEDVTIGALGAFLGALSRAKVSESVAWVGGFDFSGGALNNPAFGNGVLVKTQTKSALNALSDKNYVFLYKKPGYAGTFASGEQTAAQNDFSRISRRRTIDKAIRLTRAALTPMLGSNVTLNDDGTLNESDVQAWTALASAQLTAMQAQGEISGFQVFIDPSQDVLSDDEIEVSISIVPVGISDTITVKIGFETSI